METTPTQHPLTPELITRLLATSAETPADPIPATTASPEYARLMEIYCVVKVGGVAEQLDVAQRLEAKERAELQAEIQALSGKHETTSRVQALMQEIQELERSVRDRVQYLKTIRPEEEAAVRDRLTLIEAQFRNGS